MQQSPCTAGLPGLTTPVQACVGALQAVEVQKLPMHSLPEQQSEVAAQGWPVAEHSATVHVPLVAPAAIVQVVPAQQSELAVQDPPWGLQLWQPSSPSQMPEQQLAPDAQS